jgi:phosphatidylglycerophosphatase C
VSGGRPVVAAFDVDGTITRRDCVRPFLQRVGGVRSIVLAVGRRPLASGRALVRRDRDALKDVIVGGVLRGRRVSDVEAEGRSFASYVRTTLLRDDVVARLRWHQQQGHRTVMVSASLRPYLEPLAASLGMDAAICTDVLRIGDTYGAHLDGGNCRAAQKAVRLTAWLRANGLADAEVWAYGDSRGDAEMLAMAHRGELVRGSTVRAVPPETTP